VPEMVIEGFDAVVVDAGATVLDACEAHGIPMASSCGGFAACNSCRVDVLDGADRLSDRLEEEDPFLDTAAQRLGCQARILGSVRLRLAPGA